MLKNESKRAGRKALLGIVILLIGLLMLLPQVWPVNLLDRPAEGEEKAAASDSKEA